MNTAMTEAQYVSIVQAQREFMHETGASIPAWSFSSRYWITKRCDKLSVISVLLDYDFVYYFKVETDGSSFTHIREVSDKVVQRKERHEE